MSKIEPRERKYAPDKRSWLDRQMVRKKMDEQMDRETDHYKVPVE